MRGYEADSVHELRRRRLLGCVAIGGVLLAAFALNGWQVTPIWRLLEDREGTFAAGDPYGEWIYAVCDGEAQQITVLRDGRVEGAAALDSLRSMRFPNWCSGLPTVDNPELGDWQAQLRDFRALTASAESARPILDAAETLPISVLYLQPIAEWIRDDEHALSFLDTVAERPMRFDHPNSAIERARRGNFEGLIANAIDAISPEAVAADRLERWLSSTQIMGSDQAMRKLADFGDASPDASVIVLQRLEAIRPDRRTGVYLSLARDLAQHSEYSALLKDRLMLLPRQDRLAAARELLARSERNADLPIALLSNLRRTFSGPDVQLQAFIAIADRLRDAPDAAAVLTRHLDDLGPMQRRLGATHLIGLDRAGDTAFTMSVLGAFGDLHPLSRPKFVYALMQSPQFSDRNVQEACLLAIQLQVRGPGRADLLEAMARHPALDRNVRSRISAELAAAAPRDRNSAIL